MISDGRPAVVFLGRLGAAYLALGALGLVFVTPLAQAASPLVGLGFVRYAPEVELRSLKVDTGQFAATVVRRSEGRATTSTTRGNAANLLVVPLLAVAVAFAWRGRTLREKAITVVVALGLGLAAAGYDVSTAVVEGLRGGRSFQVFFLDTGGRQLLGVAAGAAAVWVVGRRGRRSTCTPVARPVRIG